MKIELYSVPGDKNAELMKDFLNKHNLKFHEINTKDIDILRRVCQGFCNKLESLMRVKYSISIHIIRDYNELALKQLLEHIKKYKCKII